MMDPLKGHTRVSGFQKKNYAKYLRCDYQHDFFFERVGHHIEKCGFIGGWIMLHTMILYWSVEPSARGMIQVLFLTSLSAICSKAPFEIKELIIRK